MNATPDYPARLTIDYPDHSLNRLSTFFRVFYVLPVLLVLYFFNALVIPPLLLILFRRKYPRWWFDFNLELARFQTRFGAYFALMSDIYPSTDEEQYVHLELDYPDAKVDLNRWLPLVKWILAIPHLIVLIVLSIVAFILGIVAWFAILFTGKYPRGIFNFMEGLMRWSLRVEAYAFLMTTDKYPPFRLA